MSNLIVDGTVKAPFESLKALFEQETARSTETNVQLCVYHRGECVVDLWSSKTRDPNFGADSLVNAFSSLTPDQITNWGSVGSDVAMTVVNMKDRIEELEKRKQKVFRPTGPYSRPIWPNMFAVKY